MHDAVEYRPTDEVELLRGIHLACHAVDVVGERLLVENTLFAAFLPYLLEKLVGRVVAEKAVDECSHVAGTASAAKRPVGTSVDGIDACVVVKGQVEVPARRHMELRFFAVLVHVGAPVCVHVARELADDEVLEERLDVEILAVTVLGVCVVAGKDRRLHQVEVASDIVMLLGRNLVVARMFDGDGIATGAVEPA